MNNGISTSVFSALGFGFSLKFPLQFPSGKVPQSYILNSQAWSQMYSSKYFSLLHVTDSTIKFFIHTSNFFFLLLSWSYLIVLILSLIIYMASQVALVVRNLPANAQDEGSIPGSGRSPGVGNGNPLQYAGLGNHMDRGAWQATVHGVAKSRT